MTTWDGFYSLGGIEIANEERFRTYLETIGSGLSMPLRDLDGYEATHVALGQSPYTTPLEDRAPWVDVNDPITHGIIGMTILGVEGIEGSTEQAESNEALGLGGTVGYSRAATREMRFSALIAGLSAESTHAGLVWLRKVLWERSRERSLVPFLQGSSDLRFFLQNPEVPDQALNYVSNPDGLGLAESLIGVRGQAYAFRVPVTTTGDWAYRVTARTADHAEAVLLPAERPGTTEGEFWVARAKIWRDASVLGNRVLQLLLRFRDQYGNILPSTSADARTIPEGVLFRWKGARYDSVSEQVTPDGVTSNFVVNPNAEGTALGLTPLNTTRAKSELVQTSALSGKKAYRMTALTASGASVISRTAPARAGEQWWGRVRAAVLNAAGGQHFRAGLQFIGVSGAVIAGIDGDKVDRVPTGVFHRYMGGMGASISQEYSGDTVRVNYSRNPTLLKSGNGYRGLNAGIARQPTSVLGPKFTLRVGAKNTNNTPTGVEMDMNVPRLGEVVWMSVRGIADGTVGLQLRGSGWEAVNGAASLQFTFDRTAKTVSIPIRITSTKTQVMQIVRTSATNMTLYRMSQFGFLTGSGSYFDGSSANTGATAVKTPMDLTVGGVAPEGAVLARLVITRLPDGGATVGDQVLFDQAMLTQVDPVQAEGSDVVADPVLPAYWDGDATSTYFSIPTFQIQSSPGAGVTDTTRYDAVVTAPAPAGAVSAEIAIARTVGVSPTVGDTFYADNLLLTRYQDADEVPEYTDVTLHELVAQRERWMQNVYPIAGPTPITDLDVGGCGGVATRVEFTLVAEDPTWMRESDVIPLPLPSSVSSASAAGRAFAKYDESARGRVRNFMPQFARGSVVPPATWSTATTAGTAVTATGAQRASAPSQSYLRVAQGSGTSAFTTTISAINALGPLGGYEAGVASVWIGGSVAGTKVTVIVDAMNGGSIDASTPALSWTIPNTSADVFDNAHRVDIPLPANGAGGDADGFRIRVSAPAGFGNVYIGNPQVTLGATAFPMIWGGMPDDGTYTYEFDNAGFSIRRPAIETDSSTIFPNLTAPPIAPATIDGYNEVGLTSYRTWAAIPADLVPSNAVAVPVLRIDFERLMTRQVRVRFYPNPMNIAPETIDPSSYEHEWVLAPFKANTAQFAAVGGYMSVVIDGASRAVWMRAFDGSVIPGDQNVVASDGSPISWPEFRGMPWVVSVDYPTFRQHAEQPTNESWWRPSLALIVEE